MSEVNEYDWPSIRSGDMYTAVPTNVLASPSRTCVRTPELNGGCVRARVQHGTVSTAHGIANHKR